jgi:hypothetical protein
LIESEDAHEPVIAQGGTPEDHLRYLRNIGALLQRVRPAAEARCRELRCCRGGAAPDDHHEENSRKGVNLDQDFFADTTGRNNSSQTAKAPAAERSQVLI